MVMKIESLEQFKELINSSGVVVVQAWAASSGESAMMKRIYEKWANDFSGSLIFTEINADEQPEILEEIGVKTTPTYTAFRNGEKIKELVGGNAPALEGFILSLFQR